MSAKECWVPSGFSGALVSLSLGHVGTALLQVAGVWFMAWLGLVYAHQLLLRFYRRARGQPARPPASAARPVRRGPLRF